MVAIEMNSSIKQCQHVIIHFYKKDDAMLHTRNNRMSLKPSPCLSESKTMIRKRRQIQVHLLWNSHLWHWFVLPLLSFLAVAIFGAGDVSVATHSISINQISRWKQLHLVITDRRPQQFVEGGEGGRGAGLILGINNWDAGTNVVLPDNSAILLGSIDDCAKGPMVPVHGNMGK